MSDQPNPTTEATQAEPSLTTPAIETFDGEPFDPARAKALIEKLRAENKELKPKAKIADELSQAEQKRKEAEMTELQKAQAELKQTRAELKAAKAAEMKRTAAAEVGLPLAFADRLQGETPEDLKADAEKLLKAIPKPSAPNIPATNPGPGADKGMTIAEQRARIYGGGANALDPAWARAHGGGVVQTDKRLLP